MIISSLFFAYLPRLRKAKNPCKIGTYEQGSQFVKIESNGIFYKIIFACLYEITIWKPISESILTIVYDAV